MFYIRCWQLAFSYLAFVFNKTRTANEQKKSWSHSYMSKSKNSTKVDCSFLVKIEIAKREVIVINCHSFVVSV